MAFWSSKNRLGRSRRRNRHSGTLSHASEPLGFEPLETRTLLSASAAPAPQSGTWSLLTNTIPDPGGAQTTMLQSDGSVMVQGGQNAPDNAWYRLTPDSTGNYVNGTWSQLPSMNVARLFFPAATLPDGRVFVVGGEYSTPFDFTNSAEIFNPSAGTNGTWTSVAGVPTPLTDVGDNPPPAPTPQFGDDPIEVLNNGDVLAGYFNGPQTYLYNPALNTWTQTGTKLRNDASDEESWIKLPDGSILSYDVSASISTGVGHAQRYIPSTGTWVDAGIVPLALSSASVGLELGPGFLLPDGRVFLLGATGGNTAFYTPSTNTWTAGPSIPGGFVCADAPGAMLPNGHVLFAASPEGNSDSGAYSFPPPTKIFEFDPVSGSYTDVTPANAGLDGINSFQLIMQVLPSGQVMMTTESHQIAVYTPAGTPNDAWRPTVTGIGVEGRTITLVGTQFNGISEGAAYGDDNEMASNYPIVQLTDSSGNVFYARTFDWSSTGVATGSTPQTVMFTLPAGRNPGIYGLRVIANGIASIQIQANLAGFSISNVAQLRGDSGLTDFVFTVTQPASAITTSVAFATANGSGQEAPSDYFCYKAAH